MSITGSIIYDGECAFCIKQVKRIQKFDGKNQFKYDIRQNPELLLIYPEMKAFEEVDGLRYCSTQKEAYVGADAVYQIYSRLVPFNVLAWTYHIPGLKSIYKSIYAWIAKNRYRFTAKCEDDVCEIPYKKRNNKLNGHL
jgi:predicted DCC family thiol-disulfide oxidoreductase YuxK